MNRTKVLSIVMFGASIAACATEGETVNQEQDDIAAVKQQVINAPDSCLPFVAISRPIAAPHFHDPDLLQTAGKLTLRVGDTGVRTGTSLGTIVGQALDGAPLGNHDWLFADGGFRTQNDRLSLTPTADPCLFDVTAEIYVVESTGTYAGLTGTVTGVGAVNFCGEEGKVAITGYLCP